MPKMKTNKAIAKRVKITARGKVLRRKAGSSHLRSVKSPSRLRRFRKQVEVTGSFAKTAKRQRG
jgi:large subunit ribosomal protein L35